MNNYASRFKELLPLLCTSNPSQDDLDNFMAHWDIEAEGANSSLLLAVWRQEHPELAFNAYTAPRLDGLMRYFRFKNLSLLARLQQTTTKLEDEGIGYAIIGDGAMRLLFPELPRDMNEVHILVNTADLKRAKSAAGRVNSHGANTEEKSSIIIEDTIWGKRHLIPTISTCIAEARTTDDGKQRVLSQEDLAWLKLLHMAYAYSRNFLFQIPTLLMDIRRLTDNAAFSTEHLQQRIATSGTQSTINAIAAIYKDFLPMQKIGASSSNMAVRILQTKRLWNIIKAKMT